MDLPLDRHQMHDRVDPPGAVELLLDLAEIGEQADDIRMRAERFRQARAEQRVDLAIGQHVAERAPGLVLDDARGFQKRRGGRRAMGADFLDRALDPFDGRKVDAVILGEMPAAPHRRGLGIERQADALAFQIPGPRDAGIPVDAEEPVAVGLGREYRNRDEAAVAGGRHRDELRRGELGNVEGALPHHPVEDLARRVDADELEVDPPRSDFARFERVHAVVVAAGEAELERHAGPLPVFPAVVLG